MELLEAVEQRHLERTLKQLERLDLLVTTNLPFEQWVEIFGYERLTMALLDRLTHRVHILEANGPSYRLRESKRRLGKADSRTELPSESVEEALTESAADSEDGMD
jgi:hypothetical protein